MQVPREIHLQTIKHISTWLQATYLFIKEGRQKHLKVSLMLIGSAKLNKNHVFHSAWLNFWHPLPCYLWGEISARLIEVLHTPGIFNWPMSSPNHSRGPSLNFARTLWASSLFHAFILLTPAWIILRDNIGPMFPFLFPCMLFQVSLEITNLHIRYEG